MDTGFQGSEMKKFWRWRVAMGRITGMHIMAVKRMLKMVKFYVVYILPQLKKYIA